MSDFQLYSAGTMALMSRPSHGSFSISSTILRKSRYESCSTYSMVDMPLSRRDVAVVPELGDQGVGLGNDLGRLSRLCRGLLAVCGGGHRSNSCCGEKGLI